MAFGLNQLALEVEPPTEASSMAFPMYRRQGLSDFQPISILNRDSDDDVTPLQDARYVLNNCRQIAEVRHISVPLEDGCNQFVDHERHPSTFVCFVPFVVAPPR